MLLPAPSLSVPMFNSSELNFPRTATAASHGRDDSKHLCNSSWNLHKRPCVCHLLLLIASKPQISVSNEQLLRHSQRSGHAGGVGGFIRRMGGALTGGGLSHAAGNPLCHIQVHTHKRHKNTEIHYTETIRRTCNKEGRVTDRNWMQKHIETHCHTHKNA